jgi:cytochrome P450
VDTPREKEAAGGLDAIPMLSGAKALVGHMAEFERDRFAFLRRMSSEIDHVGRLRFSTRDVVIVNSPSSIHEVLVEKARHFDKSPMIRIALQPFVGEGLFTSGGELWRRQRKLMAPLFRHDKIDALAPVMVECATRACSVWKDGAVIDVAGETTRIAMSVAGKTLFGIDTFDESDALGHALTVALHWADLATLRLPIALQVELRLFLLGISAERAALRSSLEGLLARLEKPLM